MKKYFKIYFQLNQCPFNLKIFIKLPNLNKNIKFNSDFSFRSKFRIYFIIVYQFDFKNLKIKIRINLFKFKYYFKKSILFPTGVYYFQLFSTEIRHFHLNFL